MTILLLLALLQEKNGWADLGVRLDADGTVVQTYEGALLREGDRIVEFDGRPADGEAVMAALHARPLGRELALEVRRGGKTESLRVTPLTIEGQAIAGNNNTVHHPSARRAIALDEPEGDTVYVFDFDVSLAWEADAKELDQLQRLIDGAAELFFDMTDGQMRWRNVTVYNNREHWDSAYYKLTHSGSVGIEHVTPGGQCQLMFDGDLDRESWIIIFAHEAGHMDLGAGDEYAYGAATRAECRCIMSGDCFKGVRDLCVADSHDYHQPYSCWENLRRFYPNLREVKEAVKGPALEHRPTITWVADEDAVAKRRILDGVREHLDRQRKAILEAVEKELDRALEPR